jgi:hypothetical protein
VIELVRVSPEMRAYHEEVGLQDATCGSMLRALPKEGRVQSSL